MRRRKPADCRTCRRFAAATKPGALNVAAYRHYMDAHYPRVASMRARDGHDQEERDMRRFPAHYYSNPAVMVPWCQQVGLDPERIPVQGFAIEHEGDQHVAVYRLHPNDGHYDGPTSGHRMAVNVLPLPCKFHPDVPAVGGADGREIAAS